MDWNLLFTVINLLVLVAAMRIFLFKPVHKILDERQKQVDGALTDAEAAKKTAEELEAQHQTAIDGAEEEKAGIIRDAKISASAESDRILAEAKAQAQKILTDAASEGEMKKKEILEGTQVQLANVIAEAAGKLSFLQGIPDDGSALYGGFIDQVGEKHE
ncbi:MAG TPA: ATP synthase F0 subunit B [Oscillospiraceae bacterium]|nr:ATP synthase F0 subunit B [Oscillospiraceae bacterium]HXK78228.1 ATP synthase F0 subunit B [Oscillospiraceae bacterium]